MSEAFERLPFWQLFLWKLV